MPPLDSTQATSASTSLLTVNPYVYIASLSRADTYALLAAAAAFAIAGAMLIQHEAVEQSFTRLVARSRRSGR
jgi:hypothetical protein